jgi:hypothetical protein
MAKLRVFSYLKNEVYTLRFENDAAALSEDDKQLMRDFGEPEINVGGVILSGDEAEYTLPNAYLKVRSGFPYVREFDAKSGEFSTATVVKVEGYRDAIVSRFTAAFEALRDRLPDSQSYTGEHVYNV